MNPQPSLPLKLQAGVARADITPPVGIAHAGWGAQTHQRAAGIALPLWATALALSDGDRTVVIIDIDLLYLWEANATKVQQAIVELTGLPPSHIRLSYTHTHSGPVTGRGWKTWIQEGAEMIAPYDQSLPHRIAGAASAAIKALRPARVAAGHGRSPIAVNRRFQRPEDGAVVVGRNWEGPVDHAVQLLRIDDEQGQPLAAVVGYACHPITVGPDCDLITPDYPGVVKRVVEQATGATCLFLQGAAGNVGPIRGIGPGGLKAATQLGNMLGYEASRVWAELALDATRERYVKTLESGAPLAIYADDPAPAREARLQVATRPMRLPLRELPAPDELQAQFEAHTARLDALRAGGGPDDEIRRETMLSKRAATRAGLARELQGQTHKVFELQVFTLGDEIALVALPAEPFVEIGLAVKGASPYPHTFFSGYSNIGWAYIPMPEAYPLGGYEVEVTPLSPLAAGEVVRESLAALHELAENKVPRSG